MYTTELFARVHEEVCDKYLFGNQDLLDLCLIAYLARGHVLIEGPPGTGKTLTARLLARFFERSFKRIQFTSDMLPADIIGAHIYSPATSDFSFIEGPIFADFILADEINRTSPRTQSALLEAMEERQVTVEGKCFSLSPDFFVIATQNPREYEGTFPLPEAQLDRFMLSLQMNHLGAEAESVMLRKVLTGELPPVVETVPSYDIDFELIGTEVDAIQVEASLLRYVADLLEETRSRSAFEWGSSFRGGIAITRCSRFLALRAGRDFVLPDDVQTLVVPALRHRVKLTSEAQVSQLQPEALLQEIIKELPLPR